MTTLGKELRQCGRCDNHALHGAEVCAACLAENELRFRECNERWAHDMAEIAYDNRRLLRQA